MATHNPFRPLSQTTVTGKPEGGRRMKLNLKAKLLLAAVMAAPVAAVPTATATAQQDVKPSQEIVLSIGCGELVTVAHAGYRNKELAYFIIVARAIAPIVLGGIAALVIYGIEFWPDWGPMTRFGAFAGTLILSYKGPEIYLSNKAGKRTKEIQKGLPDALDLLVICAEAGLTVDAAFNRVAKELGRAYPELGDEFALTAIELSFLNERKMAFNNLAYRVNLEAVKGVVTTMVQTERYGTPLASALRVLSAEFRNERMMRAEEKAARLPAIMTVPLILFILPTLFVVILGRAVPSATR